MTRAAANTATTLLLILGLTLAAPMAALADSHRPDLSKINFEPSFRTESSSWSTNIRLARPIIDDMTKNKGQDTMLKDFSWEDLSLSAAYGETWIKRQDRVKFTEIIHTIEKSQTALESKANDIQKIRDQIAGNLNTQVGRWETLMTGDDKVMDFLSDALGKKVGGVIIGETLKTLGKRVVSKLVSVAGKAIGPITTVLALFDFFDAYDEYTELELMLDKMLERTETVAYLDVLLKQYDLLIAAQDKILEDLHDSYHRQSNGTCR